MANKEIGNLYFVIDMNETEVFVETSLVNLSEKEVLKFNTIFKEIVKVTSSKQSREQLQDLITGFNSFIYNILEEKYGDEDKAFNKTKEFELLMDKLILNSKYYYRGKEFTFNELENTIPEVSIETEVKYNICFFLSTFIILSNSAKMTKNEKGWIEVIELVCYLGSLTIGEFITYVQNLRLGKSS